jgi:hypothetical protein
MVEAVRNTQPGGGWKWKIKYLSHDDSETVKGGKKLALS